MNDLVLQDISDTDGVLFSDYLDAIEPYLPGGATPAFQRVWVGTQVLPWGGSGDAYDTGILDSDFRADNIALAETAATSFVADYPDVEFGWYITYEANLAGFTDNSIKTAYDTYLTGYMNALNVVDPGHTYLWSPAIWTQYEDLPDPSGLATNLSSCLRGLPSPLEITIQDGCGSGVGVKESSAQWRTYLQTAVGPETPVTLNAELFKIDGGVVTADLTEVKSRLAYYLANGVPLGPAFEIRFWHDLFY
ncbi:hypothetical protein [Streptomyces sp. NPDC057686]|uniref:hypothetical protein n=1 Tax=Streptomyces sp. NPDC057686 TaxID=3346212 RepID=UPI0036C66865